MARPKRTRANTTADAPKALLDLPTDVLRKICAACSVPDKMRLGMVCKRLRHVLANPGQDRAVWGAITLFVSCTRPTMEQLMDNIPWLLQRRGGIRAIVLRPLRGDTSSTNQTMHTALFALAGAFQGTQLGLELRAYQTKDIAWPFQQIWMPRDPIGRWNADALSATLTVLEIHYQFDGEEMEEFQYLHSLSRLEEALLRFTVYNPERRPTVVPEAAGGLPALRRLDIGGVAWCADCVLAQTGPHLTRLALKVESPEESTLDRLARLPNLRELTLRYPTCHNLRLPPAEAHADASHMTV